MPLLDHFHPPLSDERSWEGFHSAWASMIMNQLNDSVLPASYFAEPRIHWGSAVEVDVATVERGPQAASNDEAGGVATAVWAPPRPTTVLHVERLDPDAVEIRVVQRRGGVRLAAAIELISPRNKDRPAARRSFVAKCVGLLQAGVGLVVIDIVSDRLANLHEELLDSLSGTPMAIVAETTDEDVAESPSGLHAASYHPVTAGKGDVQLEIWREPLEIAADLPTLPLWLGQDVVVPLDLEASYLSTCRALRIDPDGR